METARRRHRGDAGVDAAEAAWCCGGWWGCSGDVAVDRRRSGGAVGWLEDATAAVRGDGDDAMASTASSSSNRPRSRASQDSSLHVREGEEREGNSKVCSPMAERAGFGRKIRPASELLHGGGSAPAGRLRGLAK
jgi:hypothetical protein